MDDQINIDLSFHRKIAEKLSNHGVTLFGVADLKGISTLPDQSGHSFPRAISFAVRMDPDIMASIQHYFHFHNGHNCGICAAVCPFGR
jgi:hypothetical protein